MSAKLRLFIVLFTAAYAAYLLHLFYFSDASKLQALCEIHPARLYASDGTLIARVLPRNREFIPWKKIPERLKNATVAIEDERFYHHSGIDWIGIARAMLVNLAHWRIEEGGSTITQQLARNVFLSPSPTLWRKVREAFVATEIEELYSKQEILTFYLNQVYYGEGAYGVGSAARVYFGKPASRLDLAECALIAGLPQAPSLYSPFYHWSYAKKRQVEVLRSMERLGYITRDEMEHAQREPLHLAPPEKPYSTTYPYDTYFVTYVVQKLFERYPANLIYRGGLKVYTTMNLREQEIADEAIRNAVSPSMGIGQGALVAIEPGTGFIRALVGGAGFSGASQYNRAVRARRQPGSTFKIFVYAAALERGIPLDSVIDDSPVTYTTTGGAWTPRDDDGRFWGPISLEQAFAWSRNVAAIRLANRVGITNVIQIAHRLGVEGKLAPYLSTAIGASSATPLEMATAAAAIANHGVKVNPTPIFRVEDGSGRILLDHSRPAGTRAISVETSRALTALMQAVIQQGTGTRADIGRPAAGKTGTSSSSRDAWFVGFTPRLACAVWLGNDNDSSMPGVYGGGPPAIAWARFMEASLAGKPVDAFIPPDEPLIGYPAARPVAGSDPGFH